MTLTPTSVQIRFDQFPLLTIVLNLGEMLPLGTQRFGKAVCEMKSDELRQARFIAMRQIAALMPAAKTLLGIVGLWW